MHAAEYGNELAKQLKTNVVLCNAFVVPAKIPEGGVLVWPQYEYEEIYEVSEGGLKNLKAHLEKRNETSEFKPAIRCVSNTGTLGSVVKKTMDKNDVNLIVMGAHDSGKLEGLFLDNHSRRMIDEAPSPLLLISAASNFTRIKKIAFATDFLELQKDKEAIFGLIPVLKRLNAELLLTHIYDERGHTPEFKKQLEQFLAEISNKADYPNIYYRMVQNDKAEAGLDWLCRFGNVDMLAMVHRKHSFLGRIITGSHTQKMAGHISIPLLVIPGN
jgi:nucleotide-binding universal stress UspA family protein